MVVYRVENEEGVGPYHSSWYYHSEIGYLHSNSKHPSIQTDKIIEGKIGRLSYDEYKKYFCGFKSLLQYKEWFSLRLRKLLKKHNFKLNIYKIDKRNVIQSDKQIVFKLSKAKFVKTIDLVTMEDI